MYGLWNIIKSVILAIEIQKSQFTETTINGVANVALLSGIVLGSYL
jgi:hypothetical protein